MEKRVCSKCKNEKELSSDNFCKDKYDKSGFTYQCKICRNEKFKQYRRDNPDKIKLSNEKSTGKRKAFYDSELGIVSSRKAHLKRMYNITLNQYEEMLKKQEGRCMICGGTEMNYKNKVLCVDHNHITGQVRGLLCGLCNSGLGKFKEDKQLLNNAIKYIEKYEH